MNFLENKKILIGITGGIAAYKIPPLIRHFQKAGAEVKVILTENATHFVQPELFGYLTGHPPYTSTFVTNNTFNIHHIDFQEWADLLIIAPATANFIGKMNHGIADDLLSTTSLSVTCPVLICPAMNSRMLYHISVQENLQSLDKKGVHILKPDSGPLLCEGKGEGRLPSEDRIILEAEKCLAPQLAFLKDKSVLLTVGSSREYIDPIRFITNASSGEMGLAMAESSYLMGAGKITILKGEATRTPDFPADTITCQDTAGFFQVYKAHHKATDIAFFTAALSDFKPDRQASVKIKKEKEESRRLELKKTQDLAQWAGENKRKGQLSIGFAAEDKQPLENARNKIKKKFFDALILNIISPQNPAFSSPFNEVHLLFPESKTQFIEKQSKKFLARKIMIQLGEYFQEHYLSYTGGK